MSFRAYGYAKESKTAKAMPGVLVRLYLNEEEIQKGKSAENGFYELIAEIEDSRIETGQQLRVTFEKEGYKIQEHRVLATEGSFNLDVALEPETKEKKPFNWLPVIIAGSAVVVLLVGGVIAWLLLRSGAPKVISFSADPNTIEAGESAMLSWETEKATSVEISFDQNIAPVEVESSGSIQVEPTQSTEYVLTAKGEKKNTEKSLIVEVEDIVPPELTVTHSPPEPTTEDEVTFIATALDAGGISKIQIYVNDEMVKEATSSPCEYVAGPYSLGSVTYKASAWDKSNNKGDTDQKSVTIVDSKPPRVTIKHVPPTPTTKDQVAFTAEASDQGGGSISKVQIYINGKMVKECTSSLCEHVAGPYSHGSVTYAARAWDTSNNQGDTGPQSFTPRDEDGPELTITHEPSEPSTEDEVTFTATVKDSSDLKHIKILVKGDIVEECNSSPCKYVADFNLLGLGKVTYEARAEDRSNNLTIVGPNTFNTMDRSKPDVMITYEPAKPSTEDEVTFTATASDRGGGQISKVQIYINDEMVKECDGSPCKYAAGPYPLANISCEAHALDTSGNEGKTEQTSFMTVDATPPEVTIVHFPETPSTEENVTFLATASDRGGGQISKVQIFVSDKMVKQCDNAPCQYDAEKPYPAGKVTYKASAWDSSDNRRDSQLLTFTVKDEKPPDVAISHSPFTVNLSQKVAFTASVKDPTDLKNIKIYVNGEVVQECDKTPCSCTKGPYSIGNVNYEARAWDKSGNMKLTGSKVFTVMNFNFESGNLLGWTQIGTAFKDQPTYGDNPTRRGRGQPSKHQGQYWIGTYERYPQSFINKGSINPLLIFQGDGPTGILTSHPFVIQSGMASFLVGGGNREDVGIELLVNGKVVRSARGKNIETMERVTWNLTEYVNKTATLRIVDKASQPPWGHINFDDFYFVTFQIFQPIKILKPVIPIVPFTVVPKQ
ncbi:MAG: Ig-like domain-containing protein [bacterium]